MKKQFLVLLLSLFVAHTISGQRIYNVDNIADSLTKNADAVIRFYKTSYKIISNEKYVRDVHYAITILNPNGKHIAELAVSYDRNTRVSEIEGYTYNKYGALQGKLKKKDIRDYAANGNYTLFSDNRLKYFNPAVTNYPFTIEYKYTIESSGTVGFDTWLPQKWFNISVETAELSFSAFDESDLKYKELNHDFNTNKTLLDDATVYTWSVKNLMAIEYGTQTLNYLDFMPAIMLSPNKIIYEGTKGDFSTWESYGKWVYSLINGRDELSEETIVYIKTLTDTISSKKDKIKAVYKYMQSKTRYVNIALGVGGFQPITAKVVDEKGYGDCKALSNYTKALLKCAGIDSYYAEIGTGKYQEIKFTNFASANQTNHIILCVPIKNDTIWLECTNQKIPFGFLSPGSQNRYALLIKPNGGELAKTFSYNTNENTRISNIKLDINAKGEAKFELITEYNNNLYSEIFSLLNSSKKEQKDELLINLSSSRSIKIESFSLEDNSINNAQAKLHVKGTINNFASVAGSRIFFAPDFFYDNKLSDFISDNRKLDIYEPIGYTYIDTLTISLPEGYSLDNLQNSYQFNSVYGQCEFNVVQIENKITIIKKLSINGGKYNCSSFGEINEFVRSISDYENKKIIINNE